MNVARDDGTPDPINGDSWFWILEWIPSEQRWGHLDKSFEQSRVDLRLDDSNARVARLIHGDVDGDGREEIVISAPTTGKPNAFWVYDLVDLPTGLRAWQPLSPGLDASQPSFECDPPSGAFAGWKARLEFTADVDGNGRDEILAAPDAPGGLGSGLWIMTYDPPATPGPGSVGTWRHLTSGVGGNANEDLVSVWPWPARIGQALVGRTGGPGGSTLLLCAEASANPVIDPNRFFEVRWDPTDPSFPWTTPDEIDCSTQTRRVTAAVAADSDDDGRDELVAVIESQGRRSAWVMDRQPNGSWQHMSPITGHADGADLEWTSGDDGFKGVVAADVDLQIGGQLHTELVFYGSNSNEIWIVRYDAGAWEHLSPALPTDLGQNYLLLAYRALLVQLGTSYEEIRAVQAGTPAERKELCTRLGVPDRVDPGGPETIERLLVAPADLSEARLEELFGLVDTTRNPLSSVPVRGDARGQVKRVELEGTHWSRNPSAANVGLDGDLELSLSGLSGGRVSVTLTRPGGGSVASATGDRNGRLWLGDSLGSGLSGWLEVAYTADATGIELSALPNVAAWRLEGLRRTWDGQDWAPGAEIRLRRRTAGHRLGRGRSRRLSRRAGEGRRERSRWSLRHLGEKAGVDRPTAGRARGPAAGP